MKTTIIFIVGIMAAVSIPMQSSAQRPEKIYSVTEEGDYQFTFMRDETRGAHPITPRTFYLETARQGLLAPDISYGVFLNLSKEEQRQMVETAQYGMLAEKRGSEIISTSINAIPCVTEAKTLVIPAFMANEDECASPEETTEKEIMTVKEQPEIPWMVRVVTNPNDVAHGTNEVDENCIPLIQADESKTADNQIPWIVRAITMHDYPLDLESLEGGAAYFEPEEDNRRARIFALLNTLLVEQDDEIQQEYGRVFPGMDGKLYGTSDAELDEILSELLRMREDFSADLSPELHDLFNELETLAMGR